MSVPADMTRIILLSSLALSIAGCQPMDAVEGKSPNQEYAQRLALLEAGMAKLATPQAVVEPVAFVAPPEVEPEPEPVEPPCVPVFRVVVCDE